MTLYINLIMKKKVVFLVTNLGSGGIENYLLRFIRFYQHEIDAYVVCTSGKSGILESDYKSAGAHIILMKIGYLDFGGFRTFRTFLKKHSFTCICAFTGNFAAFPLLIAKTVSVTKRIAFYRNAENRFKENLIKIIFNKISNFLVRISATKILSNSYAAFNYYHSKHWEGNLKFEVIYNGLDTEQFLANRRDLRPSLNIPKDAFVVGHVGRYNPAKNHITMIDVATTLCNRYKDIYFIFCGQNVEHVVDEWKGEVSERIMFLPYRRDINSVLYSLDCFYFPSLTEGQPNALIEAMISDLPIVASNIASIKEIIPSQLHEEMLILPLDKRAAVDKITNIYLDRDSNPKLAEWTQNNFKADMLFGKFFANL